MPAGKRRILSKAITVETVHGSQYKRSGAYVANRITDATEENEFLEHVTAAFDKLVSSTTGRLLVDEIDNSGHTCVVFRGDAFNGGAAILQDVGDKRATVDRYALPLSDYATMCIGDDYDITGLELANQIARSKQNVRDYNNPVLTDDEKSYKDNNYIFLALYNILDRKFGNATNYISGKTGVAADDIEAFRFNDRRMTPSENFRLSLGLYEHLFQGKGADTAVRLIPGIALEGNKTLTFFQKRRGKTKYQIDVDAVRADVMLGHELVHAWRMMTGRRIVARGWEEEMMTVGLGPAASLRFTENRLRAEAGHPLRTSYNLSPTTAAGRQIKASTEG